MSERDAFAGRLNGREIGQELAGHEEREARDKRLLVAFGYSDDLTEFRGIINDEVGAYDGQTHRIILDDGRPILLQDDEECERCTTRLKKLPHIKIEAEWCPDGFPGSWRISATVPHATFDIMEDGDLFCRGIVIDEADLIAALIGPLPPT